ncbi:MAG: hypothetical protein HQL75_07825 [Magnetococcales bacterium]|nr:hypothetical protein [Magnetococcales bacterium]
MSTKSLTLIITQRGHVMDDIMAILQPFPGLESCHLFFLHHGVGLVDQKFPKLPQGQRVYCAFDHENHRGPLPAPANQAGSLATLGQLLHKSEKVACWPNGTCGPVAGFGIHLDGDPELAQEGLRIATGLAGCDLSVTLFAVSNRKWKSLADLASLNANTMAIMEALIAMNVFKKNMPLPDLDHQDSRAIIRL